MFALLTLPVVLFVGLATFVRLLEINNEDVLWVTRHEPAARGVPGDGA